MSKIDLLKKISKSLSPNKVDFSAIDNELNLLKKKLEETVNIQTVDDVSRQLKNFQKKIDLEPVKAEIRAIGDTFAEKSRELRSSIEEKSRELETAKGLITLNNDTSTKRVNTLTLEVSSLRAKLAEIEVIHESDVADLNKTIDDVRTIEGRVNETISKLSVEVGTHISKAEVEKKVKELQESIDTLRRDLSTRISNIGGGSPNQQINVNSSVMSTKYADFNFVSDTAIRWVASDDTVNKRVNIRASVIAGGGGSGTPGGNDTEVQFNDAGGFGGASVLTWNKNTSVLALSGTMQLNGGTSGNVQVKVASVAGNWTMTLPPTDGSANQVLTTDGNGITVWASVAATGGSGITRTTSIISVDTTGADSASTDYVYFANVGIRFTLPTAVANNNLYTVKNYSASSVLVLSGEGIDDSPNALMPTNYESLSFISNGSVWGVV